MKKDAQVLLHRTERELQEARNENVRLRQLVGDQAADTNQQLRENYKQAVATMQECKGLLQDALCITTCNVCLSTLEDCDCEHGVKMQKAANRVL